MNMINGRSHQELAPTISSPHFPAAPSTAEADDIRRRNLMLSTATGAQQNGLTPGGGKKRVLAPESSSPQTQQQPGGFLAPGEAFNPALLQFRNPPTTLARGDSDEDILGTQSLHRGGSFNGTSLQAAAATRGNEPPPRKKLMRAGDYEQRNSRDTSAEVEEVGPSITSPVASASGSPVTSPAHLPGTNTPLTAMRQNLSHVHLQRTASNTSSTASLHGRSGLSRNDDESLPSVLDAVPVSASAEDGAMPEDESSPAVGRRRRTAAKKRIVETDDEDADGDFDIEMGGGDDDGGSDGEYLDEEQPERKAPAPVPQAHRTAPQTQPPQYQQYQHHQQQLRAPVPIQPRHATIPDQQQAYRQQHSMSPHLMSPHHGVSPHAISPMPYSQPSPSMAFAQLAPTRSPSTMSQPLPPAQASGNFTQDAVATAQEAFVRFRSGCFPMMPFNEVRQAWIESGGRPDLATTILINKSANVDRRTPAQWSEPPAATRSPVMAPAPAPSSGRPLIPVPHPSSFAPQQQFAPQQPQSPYGAQAGQPSPYNLPSYPQTSAYSTAPSYIPQPQPPMIQIQSQMTRVAQSPSGPPLSAGYRGPPTGSSGGSVYSPHGAYGQSSGYPRPMQGHPLPYAQPPQPGRANIQQYAPPQNQYGVQPQQYRPAQYAPQPQQQQRQPYQQPITQVPQPQQQVLLKKKRRADSEDSDGGYSDNDTGDRYNERDRAEKESQALRFFNVCKVEDLQDLTSAFFLSL